MLELRKMNIEDAKQQWEYVTAMPADENGLTNPYERVSFEEYMDRVLPELIMHENPVNMPDWFVPETYYYLWDGEVLDLARNIVPKEEIYLRVLKRNTPSFTVIIKNGAYVAGEDETHYLLRVRK